MGFLDFIRNPGVDEGVKEYGETSGARIRQAVEELKRMGCLHVKNIGGITAYTGKVERV